VVVDLKGTITTFNRGAVKITGLLSEEVKGEQFDHIFGRTFFRNSPIDLRSLKDIQENTEIEAEINRNGKHRLYVCLSIAPLKNFRKQKTGVVLTLQDITRMKKLEEQANRTDRLAAMGEMAAKIAHEIRNPLGSIELFSTALMNDLGEFGELKELAEHISSGVKSINTIISNLLMFIKPQQKPDFAVIDIHDNLDDALFFSNHLMNSVQDILIIKNYFPKPLMVRGDSDLLKQMSLNLILNAIQAMSDGGKLTIFTREAMEHKQRFVEIGFVDTGKGMSREDMFKIFDPFFTTKSKGTGLGLAIVHNIIKVHEGTIDISNSENEGTECIVTLPLWEG